jgi:hypothetical protein
LYERALALADERGVTVSELMREGLNLVFGSRDDTET